MDHAETLSLMETVLVALGKVRPSALCASVVVVSEALSAELGLGPTRRGEGVLLPLGPASGEQVLPGHLLSAPRGAAHSTSLLHLILSSLWPGARLPLLLKTRPLGRRTRPRREGPWSQLVLAGGPSPVFSPPLSASSSSSARPPPEEARFLL